MGMPNIKSSIKRVKVEAKKAEKNKHQKSKLRTYLKNARIAVEEQGDDAQEQVRNVTKLLDQASGKGIISKQKAARHKSQLTKALNTNK